MSNGAEIESSGTMEIATNKHQDACAIVVKSRSQDSHTALYAGGKNTSFIAHFMESPSVWHSSQSQRVTGGLGPSDYSKLM